LAHLLNAVLNDSVEHKVTSINNVELKSTILRSCIFDVHCTLSNDSRVIIELQKANMRDELFVRLVSRSYGEQWRPGGVTEARTGGSYKLVPVKIVAIIDFTLEPVAAASGTLVQNYTMCARSGTAAPSALRRLQELCDVTLVQLSLAPKDASSLNDMPPAALWAHLLRYSHLYSMATLPEALQAAAYATVAASARNDALTQEERAALKVEEEQLRDAMRMDRLALVAEHQSARADEQTARADEQTARADSLEQELRQLRATQQAGAADDTHAP
jgi:hypothetical protein